MRSNILKKKSLNVLVLGDPFYKKKIVFFWKKATKCFTIIANIKISCPTVKSISCKKNMEKMHS